MKIVKPLKLGLIFRPFQSEGRSVLSIATFCMARLNGPAMLDTEPDMWEMVSADLGKDAVLDMGMPKPHSEVLISGAFYPQAGRPVPAGKVKAGFANWRKSLYIFGERFWKRNLAGAAYISDPIPADKVDINYANAYGGERYAKNPVGKGDGAVTLPSGEKVYPLPAVESPEQLVVSKDDKPDPAGFGPLDIAWPQRMSKAGTYDQKWLHERFPDYAADMDWSIFNMAPQDQQFQGYLNGTETFFFEHMHPEKPLVEGRLPGLRPRCFAEQNIAGSSRFIEASCRLDTAWFFPHREKVLLVYRSLVEVEDEDAEDIQTLLLACEGENDPTRTLDHYRQALEKRSDEENGHLHALNESDLLPLGEPSSISELMDKTPEPENKLIENMDRRALRQKDKAVARLEALGLDPAEIIKEPDQTPQIDISNIEALPDVIEKLIRQSEEKKQQMESDAAKRFDELGLDMDEVRAEAEKARKRWPKFSADENIEKLRSFGVEDPEAERQLKMAEQQVSDTTRPVVHHLPPSYKPSEEEAQQMAETVKNSLKTGQSLKDEDLAYVDLSGMDLSGIDLSGAYLEGADFSGAQLQNANLSSAILVRADLSRADFSDARLTDANLSGSRLTQTNFSRAVLASAVLADTRVDGAVFEKTDFHEADFTKAVIASADFDRSVLKQSMFMEAEIRRSSFRDADVSECTFMQANLQAMDFSGACLSETLFVNVSASQMVFDDADMGGFRLVGECALAASSFLRAKLTNANLRASDLSGSTFKWADVSESDFSQCNLKKTIFSLAKAHQTQFVKANLSAAEMVGINLMEGNLQKAILNDVQLRASNLYAVDFMKARFQNTDLRESNLKKAFLEPWFEQ